MTDLRPLAATNGHAHLAARLSLFQGEREGHTVRIRVRGRHAQPLPRPGDLLRVAGELLPKAD